MTSTGGLKNNRRAGRPVKKRRSPAARESTTLIALLIDEKVLFISWSIPEPHWLEMKKESAPGYGDGPGLLLELCYISEGELFPLEEHWVFERENRWHLFPGERIAGMRIVVRLSFETADGGRRTVAISKEVDIPLARETVLSMLDTEKAKRLYDLSEAGRHLLDGYSGMISS
jgi:predicted component of type VI protein secretion system